MKIYHSAFLKLDIDLDELSHILEEAVGEKYELKPLKVKCTYPVFRGKTAAEKFAAFIKICPIEEWKRALTFTREMGTEDLFAQFLTESFIPYKSYAVIAMHWKGGYLVQLDEMNERQAKGLIYGCVHLTQLLQRVKHFTPVVGSPRDPEIAWQVIETYARHHPIASIPMRDLLSLPRDMRTYAGRKLVVVHGDFHAKNYGFMGPNLSSVFDMEKLTQDLACGDFIQTLVYRYSELGLTKDERQRLWDITQYMFHRLPWPREEVLTMIHIWRIRFAAHRIRKHPHAFWTGLDIARRDRRISELIDLYQDN